MSQATTASSSQLEDEESETLSENYDDGLISLPSTSVSQSSTTSAPVPKKAPPKPANNTNGNSLKRQRSVADVFGGDTESASKKTRVSNSTAKDSGRVTVTSKKAESSKATIQTTLFGSMAAAPVKPFNLGEYLASLTPKQARLLALETHSKYGIGRGWLKHLGDEIKKDYFLKLKEFLESKGVTSAPAMSKGSSPVYPPAPDIYTWSRYTPLSRVKVVILGQDPYHGPRQAHGLSFSVRDGVPPPPSLKNIFKEIGSEYGLKGINGKDWTPGHGFLGSLSQSGVLLLNACLTVDAGKPNSHQNKGWEQFTQAVIQLVDKYGGTGLGEESKDKKKNASAGGVVFLGWGAPAAKRLVGLNKTKHLILQSPHPSPLSAAKGFFGNGHFKQANAWLEKRYGKEAIIDWTALGKESEVQIPEAEEQE